MWLNSSLGGTMLFKHAFSHAPNGVCVIYRCFYTTFCARRQRIEIETQRLCPVGER